MLLFFISSLFFTPVACTSMDQLAEQAIRKAQANVLEQQSDVVKDIYLIQDLLLKKVGLSQKSPVIGQLKALNYLILNCEDIDVKQCESIIDDVRKQVSDIFKQVEGEIRLQRNTIDTCNNQQN